MIDSTVTIGNIIEILTIAGGGIIVFSSLRFTVGDLKTSIMEMKVDIRALNGIVVKMALADQRLERIEDDMRELRHGRGFIRDALEGEWPKPAREVR